MSEVPMYLDKEAHPSRTLQYAHTYSPAVVLRGGAAPEERGAHVHGHGGV